MLLAPVLDVWPEIAMSSVTSVQPLAETWSTVMLTTPTINSSRFCKGCAAMPGHGVECLQAYHG